MAVNPVPMTLEGFETLQSELTRLKKQERPRITQAIAEARAHGDLKENAEYHAAREQQGFAEARIRDIEAKLSHCQVIDVKTIANEGKVIFGSTVVLLHVDEEREVRYHIVGEDEADLKQGKISVTSPIARALVGKLVDEEVIVTTPQGEIAYEIVKVEYV